MIAFPAEGVRRDAAQDARFDKHPTRGAQTADQAVRRTAGGGCRGRESGLEPQNGLADGGTWGEVLPRRLARARGASGGSPSQ